ncbi:MAG: hypothetical protein R2828_19295 [Saprospiraceae bacterium]
MEEYTKAMLTPYPLQQYGPNEFFFTSNYGNTYEIGFYPYWQKDLMPMYTDFDLNLFEIYFEVVETKYKGRDRRIPFTLMNTIAEFVSVDDRIGFFVIQREDGRSKQLLKVYNLWFQQYEQVKGETGLMTNRVVSMDGEIASYLSCVLHHNNSLLKSTSPDELLNQVLKEIYPFCELDTF